MNIHLAVAAEVLQAEISPIQRFVKGVRHFGATFEVEGLVFPPSCKGVLLIVIRCNEVTNFLIPSAVN